MNGNATIELNYNFCFSQAHFSKDLALALLRVNRAGRLHIKKITI